MKQFSLGRRGCALAEDVSRTLPPHPGPLPLGEGEGDDEVTDRAGKDPLPDGNEARRRLLGRWDSRRVTALALGALLCGLAAGDLGAQTNDPGGEDLGRVLGTLRLYTGADPEPARTEEPVRLALADAGHARHLAAPPTHAFQPAIIVRDQPEETARQFLLANRSLFGLRSLQADLRRLRVRPNDRRTSVRLEQIYAGVPVFAGQAAVQLNAEHGVEFVAADLSVGVNDLDGQDKWTAPTISSREVTASVSNQVAALARELKFTLSPPQLWIFDPAVLGENGAVQLVWEVKVDCDAEPDFNEQWLVDAKSGEVARRYPLSHSALDREVLDAGNANNWPGNLVRDEGDPATGIADVDSAYLFLGQSYNFYWNNHGRDSLNDGGMTIRATARYCSATACPWSNAQWVSNSDRLRFGAGFATDDVVGHEFTHGVTEFTSGLVYANASGAINESFSDIWGEFIDLGNNSGDDSAGVRWDIGEDVPGGRIRSMSDPPDEGDPDRIGSSLYVPAVNNPNNGNDFGGVHINSGVNNKLAFLLTDGQTFNGQTVDGMGIARVADLYYEANANLLTAGSDWDDLFEALRTAAVNLGWTSDERNNLYRACRAVEIADPENLYVNPTVACLIKNGRQTCNALLGGPFTTVSQAATAYHPGDRLYIRGGSYNENVTFRKITTIRSFDGAAVIGN